VIEATNTIEGYINQITTPLEHARQAAKEAKEIPNLPDYVKWRLDMFLSEIFRAVGGSDHQPAGVLQSRLSSIRDVVPQDALQEERTSRAAHKPLF
jgi:hypothetical protein